MSIPKGLLFIRIVLTVFITAGFFSCTKSGSSTSDPETLPFIRGVYGNPATLTEAGYRLDHLGLNAIFIRSISLNQSIYETAKSNNIRVFVEFPTLLGRNYVEDHPDAWPIDETGEKSPPADWFLGVCPTDPNFLQYRKTLLREILETYDVDGIFLDYVHWHAQFETPDPILPETCFCNRCTTLFSESSGTRIQGQGIQEKAAWILDKADPEWRKWRSGILNNWISELKEILHEVRPEALLGIFYCAWYPDDYDGALYKTLGIDIESFIEMADVLSPMLFHKMKNKPTTWISEYTDWLGNMLHTPHKNTPLVWPIVQAHDNPETVTASEFREVMLEGSKPPSSGIMMFSDRALLDNTKKIDVMMEFYLE